MTLKNSSINSLRTQRGLSSIAWLAIISGALMIGFCTFKVAPFYFDNMLIVSTLESLPELIDEEGDVSKVSKTDINSFIGNRFTVNNIRSVSGKDIEVRVNRDNFVVDINYERRVHLFSNIEALITFKNQFDSSRPNECCTPLEDE